MCLCQNILELLDTLISHFTFHTGPKETRLPWSFPVLRVPQGDTLHLLIPTPAWLGMCWASQQCFLKHPCCIYLPFAFHACWTFVFWCAGCALGRSLCWALGRQAQVEGPHTTSVFNQEIRTKPCLVPWWYMIPRGFWENHLPRRVNWGTSLPGLCVYGGWGVGSV